MKKSLFLALSLGAFVTSFAQNDYKKQQALSVGFIFNDFKTASDLRSGGLANVVKDKQWTKAKRMSPGLAVSYLEGLGSHVDFAGTLSGSFVDYPIANTVSDGSDDLLLEAVATANIKLVTDKYWCSPFFTLGVGTSKYKGYFGAFIPTGVGLQINLFDEAYILLNSQYRIPVTENVGYHLYHSIGIVGNIKRKK
jgi:OOP family OmpA-OmpF porin